MSMRAAVVVGLVALLCGVADAKPKKRKSTFAAYIDPAAAEDPRLPWPQNPEWLAVAVLIDRSADSHQLDAAKAATRLVVDGLDDWDMAALVAFDTELDTLVSPRHLIKQRKAFKQALASIKPGRDHDLASVLDEMPEYMTTSPDRKLIVLFADVSNLDDKVAASLRAIHEAYITLVIVELPNADRAQLADKAGGKVHILDGDPSSAWSTTSLENLPAAVVDLRGRIVNARSTTGSARSASPPLP